MWTPMRRRESSFCTPRAKKKKKSVSLLCVMGLMILSTGKDVCIFVGL
jgi:hypothetical protein